MTVSHHHQDGNLIPLLPCYYQLDFACFVDKVGNQIPDGTVIFIDDFQFMYHKASNSFEVYTGIPAATSYEAQSADFDILLNYFPLDHPSHPKNTENPSSLVHASVSAQLNGPSLGNSSQLVPSTVNHCLNTTKENVNKITFVKRRIPKVEQQCTQFSIKCSHTQPPSRQ